MPRKKRCRNTVRASDHAAIRGTQRAGRDAKQMEAIMTAALREQLRVGIPVKDGHPMLNLDGERLGLENDLVAPLDMPNEYGIWEAITVKPK